MLEFGIEILFATEMIDHAVGRRAKEPLMRLIGFAVVGPGFESLDERVLDGIFDLVEVRGAEA